MVLTLLLSIFVFDPSIHDAFEAPQAAYLAAISSALMVYLILKKQIHLPHWPVFGAWLGMDFFSLVAAVNPYQALYQIWIDAVGIVAFYFTINYLDRDDVRGLTRIITALAGVIALWALASLYFPIDPPLGNLQIAGMVIAPALVLALGLPFGYGVVLCPFLWGVLIMTGSKIGMISVIGSLSLILWSRRDRARIKYIAAMPFIVIAVLYVAAPIQTEPSHYARFYWAANTAWMIKDHPFIGVGRGNWPLIYPAYAATWGDPVMDTQYVDLGSGKGVSKNHINAAHNDYLQMLAEIGPVGLVAFLAALFGVLKGASRDREGMALYGAILTILIYASMSFPFAVASVTALFWVLMGCLWLMRQQEEIEMILIYAPGKIDYKKK